MYFKDSKGFPSDFLWGSASAAYQVEGAWDSDGFYYLNDQKHTVKVTTDKQRNILFSIPANDFKNGDKLKIVINLVDKTGITSQIEKNFIVAIIDDSVSLYEE